MNKRSTDVRHVLLSVRPPMDANATFDPCTPNFDGHVKNLDCIFSFAFVAPGEQYENGKHDYFIPQHDPGNCFTLISQNSYRDLIFGSDFIFWLKHRSVL